MLEELTELNYELLTKNHALAILQYDFSDQLQEIVEVLSAFRIQTSELIAGGGGEAVFTQRLRHALTEMGWPKHVFQVQTIVDGHEQEGITHEIDHVRQTENGRIALEIEWNNKDPFYDRDLENFQRLHAISAISLGVIITRGASLQSSLQTRIQNRLELDQIMSEEDLEKYGILERTTAQRKAVKKLTDRQVPFTEAFAKNFVSSKFGKATTHWDKLIDRVNRGVGNPCPLLLIGLPETILEG